MTSEFDNCAVLIGVNDYSAYDTSMNLSPGTSDLPGSQNDAAVFWRVCLKMGFSPERIRILTSPRINPATLEGGTEASVREATEPEILDAVEWLANTIGGKGGAPGLLAYSGHGDWLEKEGLVICPSDTEGQDLTHAIPFGRLKHIFEANAALANLTLFLDCCHSGATTTRNLRRSSLRGAKLEGSLAANLPRIGGRELCAAKPGGTSWQASFSGVWRGAFSWALACVMDQWQPRAEGKSVELDLSYSELLSRTAQLLTALSFDQDPVLRAEESVSLMPLFHRGVVAAPEATSDEPTAHRFGGQLQPDVKYIVSFSEQLENWTVLTFGSQTLPGYTSNTEYWGLDASFVNLVNGARTGTTILTFSGTPRSTNTPTEGAFGMPTSAVWTQMDTPPSGPMFLSSDNTLGLVFQLVAPNGELPWSGTMTWYCATNGAAPTATVVGEGTTKFTYNAVPSNAHTWFRMTLPPLTWNPTAASLSNTANGIALSTMSNITYAAFRDSSTNVRSCLWNGSAWTSLNEQITTSRTGPGLATLNTTLYLAILPESSTYVTLYSSTDGSTWTNLTPNPQRPWPATLVAPALGVYNNATLCLAYFDGASTVYSCVWTGRAFSNAETSSKITGAVGAPALCGFSGKLYVANATQSGSIEVRASASVTSGSNGVITWGNAITLSAVALASAPALGVFQDRLFLACVDNNQNVWLCSSSDGSTWSAFTNISTQLAILKSPFNPALAANGLTQLLLAYAGTSGPASFSAT